VIAFSDNQTLWVMNEDGSNQVAVFSGDVGTPSWAPYGDGTRDDDPRDDDPWRLVFQVENSLATLDIDTVGGTVNATNFQPINIPGPAYRPDWGSAGEIVYKTRVLVLETGLLHDAIYVIADAELPDPVPTEVYMATDGRSEANNHTLFVPVWGPSGRAIAFGESDEISDYVYDRTLRIIDRATGDLTTVLEYGYHPGLGAYGMAWSNTHSNPQFLALVEEGQNTRKPGANPVLLKLQITDSTGKYIIGQPTPLATGITLPTWSPDDSVILVRDKGMRTIDATTGDPTAILARNVGRSSDWRR
jgi:hypothetical protein